MIKAYPRVWVDLNWKEMFSVLTHLALPHSLQSHDKISEFETAYAKFIGTREAISFPKCRSALYFILKALEFEKGSEIILPAYTFWVDVEVVILNDLVPVFVDVDLNTQNIQTESIESAITPKTKAILFPHLNGLACDMDAIEAIAKKHHIRIIEDCARACGGHYKKRRLGSTDIGAFSFGYGKSFYAIGGGAVTTNDLELATRLRDLKKNFQQMDLIPLYKLLLKGSILKVLNTPSFHGLSLFPCAYDYQAKNNPRFKSWFEIRRTPYDDIPKDFHTDMNNVQVKIALRQIASIDKSNQLRKRNMAILNEELRDLHELIIPDQGNEDCEHVCVHYAIWTEQKNELQVHLLNNRIDAQDESAEDVTQIESYKKHVKVPFPNAGQLNDKVIYIPCHPCLNENDMRYIASKVKSFFT